MLSKIEVLCTFLDYSGHIHIFLHITNTTEIYNLSKSYDCIPRFFSVYILDLGHLFIFLLFFQFMKSFSNDFSQVSLPCQGLRHSKQYLWPFSHLTYLFSDFCKNFSQPGLGHCLLFGSFNISALNLNFSYCFNNILSSLI